jgi:hypothetical protein
MPERIERNADARDQAPRRRARTGLLVVVLLASGCGSSSSLLPWPNVGPRQSGLLKGSSRFGLKDRAPSSKLPWPEVGPPNKTSSLFRLQSDQDDAAFKDAIPPFLLPNLRR